MTDLELKALCNLLLCADTVQTGDESKNILTELASLEASKRGLSDWTSALRSKDLEQPSITHYCEEGGHHALCDPSLDQGWYLNSSQDKCNCYKCLGLLSLKGQEEPVKGLSDTGKYYVAKEGDRLLERCAVKGCLIGSASCTYCEHCANGGDPHSVSPWIMCNRIEEVLKGINQ